MISASLSAKSSLRWTGWTKGRNTRLNSKQFLWRIETLSEFITLAFRAWSFLPVRSDANRSRERCKHAISDEPSCVTRSSRACRGHCPIWSEMNIPSRISLLSPCTEQADREFLSGKTDQAPMFLCFLLLLGYCFANSSGFVRFPFNPEETGWMFPCISFSSLAACSLRPCYDRSYLVVNCSDITPPDNMCQTGITSLSPDSPFLHWITGNTISFGKTSAGISPNACLAKLGKASEFIRKGHAKTDCLGDATFWPRQPPKLLHWGFDAKFC
jgi:hypothetical protein